MFDFIKNIFVKDAKYNTPNEWIIKEIVKETKDSSTLVFDKPYDFHYLAGQFASVEKKMGSKRTIREYSFSSSPFEDKVTLTVKKIKNGKFSTYINDELRVGDALFISKPKGNFVVDWGVKKSLVAFVGGSGITPVMSIIKTLIHTNNGSKIHLFYGNQSDDSIIFKNTLENLEKEYPDLLRVTHVLENPNQNSLSGIIDNQKLDLFSENYFNLGTIDEFLICGPGSMIENINDYLLNKNIPSEKIKYELFTTSEKLANKKEYKGVFSEIIYILDEKENTVSYQDTSKTILDALLDFDDNVPYSCKSGICGTCAAKILSGNVVFNPPTINALTKKDIEKGFVLTCCSYPNQSEVVINFDETP